jgi:hypothetical protein
VQRPRRTARNSTSTRTWARPGTATRLFEAHKNLWGDLSAGSGAHAVGRSFLLRRADRLLFGTAAKHIRLLSIWRSARGVAGGLIDEWVRRGKGWSGLVENVPTPLEEGG